MPSNEGHIHWDTSDDSTINYLSQELQITANNEGDPIGSQRIRLNTHQGTGLYIPTDGWENIPGTSPTLQARSDGFYPVGYIRVRQA